MKEIRNPNSEPGGGERQMLLTVGLIFLAIIISQQFMTKMGPKPATMPPQTAQQNTTANGAQPAEGAASTTPPSSSTSEPAPAHNAGAETKQANAETETVIENDLYRVTFTNRGAQVKSWILKKHKDEKGQPLNLVNDVAAQRFGYPLSLFTYNDVLTKQLNTALYLTSAGATVTPPNDITFEYASGDLSVRKAFHFDQSFVVHVETEVRRNGSYVTAYPAWPAGFGDQIALPSYATGKVEWMAADTIHRHPAVTRHWFSSNEWVANGATVNGPFDWAGVSDQYFAAIFLPDTPSNAAMVQFHNAIPQKPEDPSDTKTFSVLGAAAGTPGGPTSLRLFVGPKALEVLQSVHDQGGNAHLDRLVDFGFFGIIAKPLFLWLKWTQKNWVHNWGWSIMVLTIIINLALFPLRYSGMKSQLKMQKVGPEVSAVNERYKGISMRDTAKQQQKQMEIQEIYKREGINPIAGCLPMVLQLPFLYAFYAMLSTTTELRHAPWMWVHDLSSADPLRLLPIFIVISMFVMQRITPMTGMDAAQARMMQVMMPIMMGAISWNPPAGLGVYWASGNIIGWGTQYIMNNTAHAKEVRAHLAKRQARKK